MKRIGLVILSCLFLFPPSGFCPPLPKDDPYTSFLKHVNHTVRHWNPNIKRKEIEAYCWSTWEGVGEDPSLARVYYYVCVQERGMVYADFFDTGGGAGYSGAGYRVIRRATGGKSRAWAKKHPFLANQYLASYFVGSVIRADPMRWHNNTVKEKNVKYLQCVFTIMKWCEKETGGKDG